MQVDLVAEGFVTRFKHAVGKLSQADEVPLLLAVSGGPDSLALMLLAHAAMPGQIVAATVDHQLRPEAAAEAAYVGELCAERAIPHRILHPAQPITGNLQSSARTARYALLEHAARDAGCALIATAHHGDDQLETVLMRLARGSGVDGMSGVRPRYGKIIRPLLEFSKSELEEICKSAQIKPVRDPSNDDAEFDRVAMRQWLAQNPHPFDVARTNRTATALQDASAALQWITDRLADTQITRIDDKIQCDVSDLPNELKRRLVLKALAYLDPDLTPRGDALDRLIDALSTDKTTTIGNILCKGGKVWHFSSAPPRQSV